jgi:hypothetical protein
MGRPKRLDNPKKQTLSLAATCHEQLVDLVAWLSSARESISRSEVVERAVARLHRETAESRATPAAPPKKKRT